MANEKRLIDVGAFRRRIDAFVALVRDKGIDNVPIPYETCNITEYMKGYVRGVKEACHIAVSQHTVDAVDVKPGQWVCLEAEIGYFACSECDHRILRAKCNYCPNCGAKMDRGVDNG